MSEFKTQAVVITGASSGIGKAMALQLALKGAAFLGIVGRNENALETVAQSAEKKGSQVFCYQKDLAKNRDVEDLKKKIIKDMGRVDVLIHSAGVIHTGHLETGQVDDFDRQYQVNVRAPYLVTQALLPLLKKYRGQIVFINSSAGLKSNANFSQYAATKHALRSMSDSLREEVNPHGIRVLSVYPGQTATPMQARLYEAAGKVFHPNRLLQTEDVVKIVIAALCLPRTAEVTDISIRPMRKP